MNESVGQKFARLYDDIDKNIKTNPSIFLKTKISIDFLWEKFCHDIELIDYIQYRFYYKKRPERRRFMTHGELIRTIKACNNFESRVIFDQKPLFNKNFERFLGRDWLDASEASNEQIKKFLETHEKIFGKQPDGMFGKGIRVFKRDEINISNDLLEEIKKNKLLLEENILQHPEIAEFNETSVNSLRIVTLNTLNDGVHVMAAVLRIGRNGRFADNFHHNGIASLVDIPTGIVCTRGIDREWNHYVLHPDSKKQIVGFTIPFWNEIIDFVKEAALVYPDVRDRKAHV